MENPSSSGGPITYYALDLEQRELERTLDEIARSDLGDKLAGKVETKGMWGTYNDGVKFIENGGLITHNVKAGLCWTDHYRFAPSDDSPPVSPISSTFSDVSSTLNSDSSLPSTPEGTKTAFHIVFLGSSLGNFSREDAAVFLRSLPLRAGTNDTLLIGIDHDNDKALIEEAYNDPKGYTTRFIFNGLVSAGRALGDECLFDETKWEYVNSYSVVCHSALICQLSNLISHIASVVGT